MINVLILYPEDFKCYTKFARKVGKIIQSLELPNLICVNDVNGFVAQFAAEKMLKSEIITDWLNVADKITHAVIFDDAEEFPEDVEQIRSREIPLRLIKIAITRVVNIKRETKYSSIKSTPSYEYIGRGSYWGNPHSMYDKGNDREEVIRKYKYDFDYEKFPNKKKSEVYKLAGKRLGCFCKPQSCHGDILANFLNSWDDGK